MNKSRIYTLLVFIILSGLEAAICGVYLINIPADPKNAIFLGYSLPRLGMIFFFVLILVASISAVFYLNKNISGYEKAVKQLESHEILMAFVLIVFLLVFLVGMWLVSKNPQEFRRYASYYSRLEPLIIWITLNSFQITIYWIVNFHPSILSGVQKSYYWTLRNVKRLVSGIISTIISFFVPEEIRDYGNRGWIGALIIWVFLPLLIGASYYFFSAVPMLSILTIILYIMLAGFLIRSIRFKNVLIILTALSVFFISGRLISETHVLNGKDLTVFSLYDVQENYSIEQDFYLPPDNDRFQEIIDEDDNLVLFRLLGNFDVDQTYIYINGKQVGKMKDLLFREPQSPFSGNQVNNYFFEIPKSYIQNDSLLTVRIDSSKDYQIGYSSGIHPLPDITHVRLIEPQGETVDLSEQYNNRRFRFQMALYIVSERYQTEDQYPLIVGTIL